MAHKGFIIKVGDLLRNPGQSDKVNFEHFMLEDIDKLTEEGVSGELLLQSVGDDTVRVVIQRLKATLDDVCDLTGEEFQRVVEVTDFSTRFSEREDFNEDRIYDDVFPLDAQSETIDVYDLLVQSIQLQEPLVHIKPGNEHLLEEYSEEEDEGEAGGNIVFH